MRAQSAGLGMVYEVLVWVLGCWCVEPNRSKTSKMETGCVLILSCRSFMGAYPKCFWRFLFKAFQFSFECVPDGSFCSIRPLGTPSHDGVDSHGFRHGSNAVLVICWVCRERRLPYQIGPIFEIGILSNLPTMAKG